MGVLCQRLAQASWLCDEVLKNRSKVANSAIKKNVLNRNTLPNARIHPAIIGKVAGLHSAIVQEVEAACQANTVVVVGMRQNPVVKGAKRLLDEQGIAYCYLEYGGYLSDWRRRNSLKMWSGWPTFPMVFIKGVLIGGGDDLKALHASGELRKLV
jgi:monothiol glutaredoxin